MPIDPSIALQYKPMELPDPLERATKQQNLLTSQAQLKESEYKLQKLQNTEAKLSQFYKGVVANGGPNDKLAIENAMLGSDVPEVQAVGLQLKTTRLQAEDERKQIEAIMRPPTAATAMPTGAPAANESLALPTASTAPVKFPTGMSLQDYTAGLATPSPYYQGANQLAANVAPTTAAAPTANAPVANALASAPAAAPVVNALAAPVAGAPDISVLRRRRDLLLQRGSPQALELAKSIDKDIALLSKITTGAPGAAVLDAAGNVIRTIPAAAKSIPNIEEFRFAKTPEGGNFNGSFEDFKRLHASRTTVNVPVSVTTEKTYGSKFAGNMADTDINKMTAAEQAPALAASANRIIDIVNKGNVFTGPAADVKLNIARALNIAGADTNEQIANTEALIAATGTSTLAAIKGAGLGTGQGFTDKDLKFLQGVAGGTVQLTAKTLTDLAELQHRAAVRSAEAWNTRVKQIPKSALEGTGVPTEPTSVPPLSKRAGPATGSVDTNNKYLR